MRRTTRHEVLRVRPLELYGDKRGQLVVFLKDNELPRPYRNFGQVYFVTFNGRGVVRGNHYHKKWREWAGVVQGKIRVVLENVRTRRQKEVILDGTSQKQIRIEIPPYTAHAFKSLTATASLVCYTHTPWSPHDDFTYSLLTS
jgi:dTDP-4-dehydrorhamnose 3,5-epimerase-like enzyme